MKLICIIVLFSDLLKFLCLGSLTDSICTTYEIHSESLSMRQGSMTAKLEETDNVITFGDGSKCTDTIVSLGMDDGAEKLSRGSLDECDHEVESPLLLFRMHEERLSPQMNYASMLKGEKVSR